MGSPAAAARAAPRRRKFLRSMMLLALLGFLLTALALQNRSEADYSAVAAINAQILPLGLLAGAKLASSDSVLEWLSGQVVPAVWKGRVCGDESCDFPEEFPAFGRCVLRFFFLLCEAAAWLC